VSADAEPMTDAGNTSISWRHTSVSREQAVLGGLAPGAREPADHAPETPVRLAASFDLMAALLADAELGHVLTLVAERAAPMAGAGLAFIALPGAVDNTLSIDIAIGMNADRIRGLNVRVGTSVIGRVFTTRRALASRVAMNSPLTGVPIGPILLLPLDTGVRTCGVLAVAGRPRQTPFNMSTQRQLLIFATTSAIMIEMAEERRDNHLS
jgi:hypothetical protein